MKKKKRWLSSNYFGWFSLVSYINIYYYSSFYFLKNLLCLTSRISSKKSDFVLGFCFPHVSPKRHAPRALKYSSEGTRKDKEARDSSLESSSPYLETYRFSPYLFLLSFLPSFLPSFIHHLSPSLWILHRQTLGPSSMLLLDSYDSSRIIHRCALTFLISFYSIGTCDVIEKP